MTTEQTTEKITTYDAPQSSPQPPVPEKSTTNSSNIDTTTTVTTEKSNTNSSNIDSTTTVITIGKRLVTGEISHDMLNKGNNKITELRTILQRESQNS